MTIFARVLSTLALALLLVSCGDGKKSSVSGGEQGQVKAHNESGSHAKKPLKKRMKDALDRGVKVLAQYHDLKSGMVGYSPADVKGTRHPGFAAMAALVYMQSPRKYNLSDGPIVRNILDWLVSLQKPDGSIFERDSANYVTSLSLSALVEANDQRYAAAISKARDFVVRLQAREDSGFRPEDKFYGGVGYGGDMRPDLSNAQFAIEAVRKAGLPQDHPFFKRARAFLERTQNRSESNDQVWKDGDGNEVRPGNDGGAIYLPGETKAGITIHADGHRTFNSYGSMSYALLRSYLFCGLSKNDPRVKAVASWCHKNFDLDGHPGFKPGKDGSGRYQGLYYYYFSMAKCLRVYGQAEIIGLDGVKINWAESLAEKLLSLQSDEGFWVNDKNARWEEASELLCTLYAMRALEQCWAALEY